MRVLYPKGPSTQIVGFQGPKTIQSMDFGTQNPTVWVLGPSGVVLRGSGFQVQGRSLQLEIAAAKTALRKPMWEFPKIGVPYFGVLIIRILLFRVLY